MFLFLRTETNVLVFETEYSLAYFYCCWEFCSSNICHLMLPLCLILILCRPKVICVTNNEWGFCLWFDDLFPLGMASGWLSIKYQVYIPVNISDFTIVEECFWSLKMVYETRMCSVCNACLLILPSVPGAHSSVFSSVQEFLKMLACFFDFLFLVSFCFVNLRYSQTREVLQMEQDVDLDLLREREDAIRKLEVLTVVILSLREKN